jgi:phage gp37-like protein
MDKENIKFNDNISYAIDTIGVAIINKEDNRHFFLHYPDAAVFSVLVENNNVKKSKEILQAVLGKNKPETSRFVDDIIANWKDQKIIRTDG